jgi:GNAT superfamily N-acetyltransferase
MDVRWLDPHRLDDRDVAGAAAVFEAARVVDCPHEHGDTAASVAANVTHGYDGNPPVVGLVRAKGGRVVGIVEVDLPRRDNRHLGWLGITVDPLARRQGIGRSLFEAGVERVRADGRRLVVANSFERTAGVGFLETMGLGRVSVEVQRRQHILDIDWERLDHDYALAERHCVDYELVRMPGRTPEHLLDDVARMAAAINDAPTDDYDVEDEVFTPERLRGFDDAQRVHERRVYRLVARDRRTGDLAGHTMVSVDGPRPWFGWQYDTSVLRAHRGHRLGFVLKAAMLRWLADEEPQLRTLDTWNAASNDHMIRVNEMLGYRVVANVIGWQRHL